jgi:hypothetical protein
MAPPPAPPAAITPSLSRSSFFGPAPSAAVSADVLEEVEGTSLQIAVAISKRHGVHNEWALAHLAWHCDLLEGAPMALECLAWSLDRLMNQLRYSRTWLGSRLFKDQHGHLRAIGRAIDKAMSERGYAVTILLQWLLTPAAQGLVAPSPLPPWAERMPPSSLALPSVPARLPTTPTRSSQGSSSAPTPPTTTGGGAPSATHHAATTLVCWVRRTWLRRRFIQQRRMRLHAFCRGASAYAVSVWGAHQPSPTPTDISSDPKVLRHPFRDRGQQLPQRRRARRLNRPRRRPGRRHRPRAPDFGGGPRCMPLCFWAAQTSVVALDAGVGTGTPHTATIEIQRVCQPHVVDRIFDDSKSDDNATPSVISQIHLKMFDAPLNCLHFRRGSVLVLVHFRRGSVLDTI